MPEQQQELRVQIELERTIDCSDSTWHTRHDESKYDRYETGLKTALDNLVGHEDWAWVKNPGPKAHGMHCRPSNYNKKLWHSMIKNEKTLKWYPDVTFCYPRVGSFEVTAVKGKQRVPVFSKLAVGKWPHPEWLAKKVADVVEGKLDGWKPLVPVVKQERKYATKKMTDDELRQLIKKKFSTLIGAFRAFDKNGDGCISKGEFMKGLRNTGIDLPKAQCEQLWAMADEDGTGNLQYQEFARKFASYKASHSLHRHADYRKDGHQELVQSLHGVDAASRVQKHAAIRDTKNLEWGVGGDKLAEDGDAVLAELNRHDASIQTLARNNDLMAIPIEEMGPDLIRAKIYKRHGNILNAFRHFDFDGSGAINYEEFMRHLPTVLGEPISQLKMESIWRAFDPDLSGEIDMNEFSNNKCKGGHLATQQGLAVFRGKAEDPTLAFAHITDKNSIVVEKRYEVTGAMSQVQDKASLNKTSASDAASTAATQSAPASPDDDLAPPTPAVLA